MPQGQLLPQLTKHSPELVLANYAHGSQETYPGELLHSPGFDLVIIFRSNPVVLFERPRVKLKKLIRHLLRLLPLRIIFTVRLKSNLIGQIRKSPADNKI